PAHSSMVAGSSPSTRTRNPSATSGWSSISRIRRTGRPSSGPARRSAGALARPESVGAGIAVEHAVGVLVPAILAIVQAHSLVADEAGEEAFAGALGLLGCRQRSCRLRRLRLRRAGAARRLRLGSRL